MKKFKKYAIIARVSFSNAVAYRANILSRFCFYTLFIYIFMSLWKAIYQEGSVHGYGYVQMVWYLIMTEFVTFVSSSSILAEMSEDVKSGSIAYLLSRPTHYIFYQLANFFGRALLNFVVFGGLAIGLGFLFVGPLTTFQPAGLLPLLLSITLGVLLNSLFLMLIGLSAFVMEDNFALYLIYQKLCFMLGMFLPVEFLPLWLQNIAKNMPFSYVCWAPAKLFVDYSQRTFVELASRQAAWVAAVGLLAFLCYSGGVKRLQANGG